MNIKVLSLNVKYCMYNVLLWFKILYFYISENESPELYKNRGRSRTWQISPGEGLQWKGEDLQCCKPSPLGEGLQCCRSSGGRSAMLQIFRGEGLQCCRPSGGKVCKGEGLQYNTGMLTLLIQGGPIIFIVSYRGEWKPWFGQTFFKSRSCLPGCWPY